MKDAVKQCLQRRSISAASVKGLLDYQPPVKRGIVDVSMHPVLQVQTDGMRSTAIYDEAFLERKGAVS